MSFSFHKRIFKLVMVFWIIALSSNGQNDSLIERDERPRKEEPPKNEIPWEERFFWGGNLGAWIGNPTFVDVSPLLGYRVTEKFQVGIGFIYNYYSYRYANYAYETNFIGGRINARYFIFENVFVQAGWDRINRDNPYAKNPETRVWIDNILVGGGLRYRISDNIYAMATGLINLNQTPLSPYPNPIIQIGFVGGF